MNDRVTWNQRLYPARGVVLREITDHDPGDEDDEPSGPWLRAKNGPWRVRVGQALSYCPRSWFEEAVPAPPEHDAGDEHDQGVRWRPLSDVSAMRVAKKLGFR